MTIPDATRLGDAGDATGVDAKSRAPHPDGSCLEAGTQNPATGLNPAWVTMGDFNGDRKLDVAVANHEASNVSVLLGMGGGTFKPQVTFDSGGLPSCVATADLNADGKLDLVVVNSAGGAMWVSF